MAAASSATAATCAGASRRGLKADSRVKACGQRLFEFTEGRLRGTFRAVLRLRIACLPGAVRAELHGFAVRHFQGHGTAVGSGDQLAGEDAVTLKHLAFQAVNRGDEDLADQ